MLPVRHRVTGSRDAPNAMSLYSKTDAIAARQRNDAMGHNSTLHGARDHKHPHYASSSNRALAPLKSNVELELPAGLKGKVDELCRLEGQSSQSFPKRNRSSKTSQTQTQAEQKSLGSFREG